MKPIKYKENLKNDGEKFRKNDFPKKVTPFLFKKGDLFGGPKKEPRIARG